VLFIIADIVASYWLALTFQASHVVSEVSVMNFLKQIYSRYYVKHPVLEVIKSLTKLDVSNI